MLLLQDLEGAEGTYKRLGAKLVVGMPFKDIATSDTLLMHSVPSRQDAAGRRALKRLQVCCSIRCFLSCLPAACFCQLGRLDHACCKVDNFCAWIMYCMDCPCIS